MNTIKTDKERPIHFGTYAIRLFAREKGISFDEALDLLDKLTTEDMVTIIYCGFIYGAKKEKIDIDFDIEDVWMWLDEDTNLLNDVMRIFKESMPQSKNLKAPQKGGE